MGVHGVSMRICHGQSFVRSAPHYCQPWLAQTAGLGFPSARNSVPTALTRSRASRGCLVSNLHTPIHLGTWPEDTRHSKHDGGRAEAGHCALRQRRRFQYLSRAPRSRARPHDHGWLLEVLNRCIHRYEGTVNQFTGDGIMALFGAPVAHEDHAVRALEAALDIQAELTGYGELVERRIGVPFQMRIGVNTGLVVVGRIGDNLRMDYTAQGDTTNLAARLEQMARPGGRDPGRGNDSPRGGCSVRMASSGSSHGEGRETPAQAYELVGRRALRSRFEAQAQRGLTRFVGRDPEFKQLLSCWALAKEGQGQVVSVVGEAGLGKSRLIHEFKERLSREGDQYLEGSCFAYGERISYLPFIQVVKSFCGVEGISQEFEAKRQISQRLASVTVDPAAVTPYLQNLLTFTVDDPTFEKLPSHLIRERTVAALTALILGVVGQRPLTLIIEDVHWIDKATEEVVATVVEAMREQPLLVMLVYRPEYLHAWANKAYHTHVPLSLLPSASSAEMVRAILHKPFASRVPLRA